MPLTDPEPYPPSGPARVPPKVQVPDTTHYSEGETPDVLEGVIFESEDPTEDYIDPTIQELPPPLTSSDSMDIMLKILEDPKIRDLVVELDRQPVHEKPKFIAKTIRAGYPEVSTFNTLRVAHYIKGAFEFIDDYFSSLDASLDSLGFTVQRPTEDFTNPAVKELRDKARQLDRQAAVKAKEVLGNLPQWARRIVAAAVRDFIVLPSTQVKLILTQLQNFRYMLEAGLTIISLKYQRIISINAGKDMLEDFFKKAFNTISVERVFRRWTGNMTEWIPTQSLREVAKSLLDQVTAEIYEDVTKKYDAYAAEQEWQASLTIDGLDTSEIAGQISTLVGILEAVEATISAALRTPETLASELESGAKSIENSDATPRPKNMAETEEVAGLFSERTVNDEGILAKLFTATSKDPSSTGVTLEIKL